MRYRNSVLAVRHLLVVASLCGWLIGNSSVSAQAPSGGADAPATVDSLEKQVQTLLSQVRRLTEQVERAEKGTPAEQTKRTRETYADRFRALRDTAGAACRAERGRFEVSIDPTGKISLSCRW